MLRLDFILGPAKRVRPGWVHAREISFKVADAQQILGHLPDPVAFPGPIHQQPGHTLAFTTAQHQQHTKKARTQDANGENRPALPALVLCQV